MTESAASVVVSMSENAGDHQRQKSHQKRQDDQQADHHLPEIGFDVGFFSPPAVFAEEIPQVVGDAHHADEDEENGRECGVIADGNVGSDHDPGTVLDGDFRLLNRLSFAVVGGNILINVRVENASIDGVLPIVGHHTGADADHNG